MAFLESLDPEESHLVVDHSHDHIGDNSFGTVVVVDVGGVVGNSAEEMEADFGVGDLVVMAGWGEMRSIQKRISASPFIVVQNHRCRETCDQKEGNGKYPQRFALSEQVCDLHPEYFIIKEATLGPYSSTGQL
jgi:hypothetical protein